MYIIYGKENCPYCVKAKNLLESKKIEYNYETLGEDFDKEWLVKFIQENFSVTPRTMPQIVKKSINTGFVYIGGYEQLKEII